MMLNKTSKIRRISERSTIVEQRSRIGDWEDDTVVGKEKVQRIYTCVERKSGYALAEKLDVEAAANYAIENKLPNIWLVGWSFGTELALKYGPYLNVLGAILLSPPLHRTSVEELERWNDVELKLVALIPELDDYLKPDEAAIRFLSIKNIELINVLDAKHLWVGESATKRVLDEIVKVVNPGSYPLPEFYSA
jgi:dienelactone hydrolase